MRKLNESMKIVVIYFISTIVSMMISSRIIKYAWNIEEWKKYIWVILGFTIIFILLIRLLKVKKKTIIVFMSIIMGLLIFILLNLNYYIEWGGTSKISSFPIMTLVAQYTTIPFQSIIFCLIGYGVGKMSYIIVPLYIVLVVITTVYKKEFLKA